MTVRIVQQDNDPVFLTDLAECRLEPARVLCLQTIEFRIVFARKCSKTLTA